MQGDQEALLRPFAVGAPRRREHGLVERRTQGVARGHHDLLRRAGRPCPFFEAADLVEGLAAQPGHIGVRRHLTHLAREQQQGARRLHQGIEPAAQHVAQRAGHRVGPGRERRRRRARRSACGRRTPPGRGRMIVASFSPNGSSISGIAIHGHRMAQNSISRAGKTPATNNAMPPDVLRSCQSGSA